MQMLIASRMPGERPDEPRRPKVMWRESDSMCKSKVCYRTFNRRRGYPRDMETAPPQTQPDTAAGTTASTRFESWGRYPTYDATVRAMESQPSPDQLQIARVKKRKLALRDRLMELEGQLRPDLIA